MKSHLNNKQLHQMELQSADFSDLDKLNESS